MNDLVGSHISVKGVVQGVGFRPFIYNLATNLGLKGWVINTTSGVEIEIEGDKNKIDFFLQSLKNDVPPLARIENIQIESYAPKRYKGFIIKNSISDPKGYQPISPDIAICDQCIQELNDPTDRRFHYPFINCTNCGPRFTIIKNIPYDRPNTTMAAFNMCEECLAEYSNPVDRRFHSQPIACPDCGPHYFLEDKFGKVVCEDQTIYQNTINLFNEGKIIAIKGIGGFHLACDAFNNEAVNELRKRKDRIDKPFALIMPDIQTIEMHCHLSEKEKTLLSSKEKPIVILRRKRGSSLSDAIAPYQESLGVMLPYNPLHYILFSPFYRLGEKSHDAIALVMTSANISEEPIAYTNTQAREKLSNIADYYLMHNRPIFTRCDDSVIRLESNTQSDSNNSSRQAQEFSVYPIRRARGYAPYPIHLSWKTPPLLACGAELKNTFCLTRDNYAFISHHIGDLENYETLVSFQEGINLYETLFKINPESIVYDLHPDYLSTKYALNRASKSNIKSIGIQHHHAHIASCMSENHVPNQDSVIGIAFDGSGYGLDGNIWGGEFLTSDYFKFTRYAHIDYFHLPGGEKAIREPWRVALSLLKKCGLDYESEVPPVQLAKKLGHLESIKHLIDNAVNSPLTSSIGRLFDGVASLIGLRHTINYEGQAAIELEAIAVDDSADYYDFYTSSFENNHVPIIIEINGLITGIVHDIKNQVPKPIISTKFHNSIARLVFLICLQARENTNLSTVALSGGVWQNTFLLRRTFDLLKKARFNTLIHHKVPTNDGGISLGQAAIATMMVVSQG